MGAEYKVSSENQLQGETQNDKPAEDPQKFAEALKRGEVSKLKDGFCGTNENLAAALVQTFDENGDGKLDGAELTQLNTQLRALTRERKLEEQSTRLSRMEQEQLLRLQLLEAKMDQLVSLLGHVGVASDAQPEPP